MIAPRTRSMESILAPARSRLALRVAASAGMARTSSVAGRLSIDARSPLLRVIAQAALGHHFLDVLDLHRHELREVLVARARDQNHVFEPDADVLLFDAHH